MQYRQAFHSRCLLAIATDNMFTAITHILQNAHHADLRLIPWALVAFSDPLQLAVLGIYPAQTIGETPCAAPA